jgi:hypothetical protein
MAKQCYIPEDGVLHTHRCENLKSYIVILFDFKTNSTYFDYGQYVGNLSVVRTDCVKYPDITSDIKLHFYRGVHYILSRVLVTRDGAWIGE